MAASACRREHTPVRAYVYQDFQKKRAGWARTRSRESLIDAIQRNPYRFSMWARAGDAVRRAMATRKSAAARIIR